jgi:hypothetical protein
MTPDSPTTGIEAPVMVRHYLVYTFATNALPNAFVDLRQPVTLLPIFARIDQVQATGEWRDLNGDPFAVPTVAIEQIAQDLSLIYLDVVDHMNPYGGPATITGQGRIVRVSVWGVLA